MDQVEHLRTLRERAESLRESATRAQAALEQVEERLREDFGCADIRQARRLLRKLRAEERKKRHAFERAARAFEEKWGHLE